MEDLTTEIRESLVSILTEKWLKEFGKTGRSIEIRFKEGSIIIEVVIYSFPPEPAPEPEPEPEPPQPEPETSPEPEPEPEAFFLPVSMSQWSEGSPVFNHRDSQIFKIYDTIRDEIVPINWNSNWEIQISFKMNGSNYWKPLISLNPDYEGGIIEILSNGIVIIYNGVSLILFEQTSVDEILEDTHYFASFYFDVNSKTLKVSYQTDSEFTNWNVLRNITNGNTTSHNLDNRHGLPSGIDRYTAYIGNSSRGYNLAFNGYIDYLEILPVELYSGSDNKIVISDINTWSKKTFSVYNFRDGKALFSHVNINDGNPNTFWIAAFNDTETVGIYFNHSKFIEGIGLKWPDIGITTENVHMRRRGLWTFYYTREPIRSDLEAQEVNYQELTPAFYLGDPQFDGQTNVATEAYFKFEGNVRVTGLKIVITYYLLHRA